MGSCVAGKIALLCLWSSAVYCLGYALGPEKYSTPNMFNIFPRINEGGTNLCGSRLSLAVRRVCKSGVYTPIDFPRDQENSNGQDVYGTNIVDECCIKECSRKTLEKYCELPIPESEPTERVIASTPPPTNPFLGLDTIIRKLIEVLAGGKIYNSELNAASRPGKLKTTRPMDEVITEDIDSFSEEESIEEQGDKNVGNNRNIQTGDGNSGLESVTPEQNNNTLSKKPSYQPGPGNVVVVRDKSHSDEIFRMYGYGTIDREYRK